MFHRFFGSNEPATDDLAPLPLPGSRRIRPATRPPSDASSRKLEAMPVDQARLAAAAAYTIARAANADLDISDEETAVIEQALQGDDRLDEPTAVLVTEMAKLQAKTVGGTEDYVVTRELKPLTTMDQRLAVLRRLLRRDGCRWLDLGRGELRSSTRSRTSSTSTPTSLERRPDASTTSCCRRSRPSVGRPASRPDPGCRPSRAQAPASCRSTRPSPSRRRTSASSSAS